MIFINYSNIKHPSVAVRKVPLAAGVRVDAQAGALHIRGWRGRRGRPEKDVPDRIVWCLR